MKKITLACLFVLAVTSIVSASSTHTVKRGDTLWAMAKDYYGDPTLYPLIAEVNGVTNPRTILDGTVLIIPNKSDMQAIANESDSTKRTELINQATGKTNKTQEVKEDTSTETDKTTSENKKNNNDVKTKYVAPEPEDTSFENVINSDINPKTIKTVNTENY